MFFSLTYPLSSSALLWKINRQITVCNAEKKVSPRGKIFGDTAGHFELLQICKKNFGECFHTFGIKKLVKSQCVIIKVSPREKNTSTLLQDT